MAFFKGFDPIKDLGKEKKIPRVMVDFHQIISEKQAKKIWPRLLTIDSEREDILKCLNRFIEKNRYHELLIMFEEMMSYYGQVIVCLDKYPNEVPRVSYADPYMMSRIGKFHVDERVASLYKYVVRDETQFFVHEEWTAKKVKTTFYPAKAELQVDSIRESIEELKGQAVRVVEKKHNLGCLPIVEWKNKQKWIYEPLSVYSWKPQLATWYPVRNLIKFANMTLSQIWKNIILRKPKIIGEFSAQEMARISSVPGELKELVTDAFISVVPSGMDKSANSIKPMMGDLQLKIDFEGYKEIYNHILLNCGFSPDNQSETMKTTSEIYANQGASSETIKLMRQLRIDQNTRLFDKVLMIERIWDGKGERPYTLSIPEEGQINRSLDVEEARIKIEANLSNYITEIARINGVSKKEAEHILKENIKVNSEVFDQVQQMMTPEEEQVGGGNNENNSGKNKKEVGNDK